MVGVIYAYMRKCILKYEDNNLLKRRNELISKCRHRKKFLT